MNPSQVSGINPLRIPDMAPFACANQACNQYNIVKLVTFLEIAPGLITIPDPICIECGSNVPSVKWGALDL